MAEFKYFLNRQGVRGPQGPQGEKGFSPDISVEKDTLSEYVLRITNEGGYFLTANLREHKEDRGGTYIRYDRATGVMYAGDADYASTEKYGVMRLATEEDLLTQEESLAVSSAILNGYLEKYYLNKVNGDVVTGSVSFKGRTGFTQPIIVDGLRGDNERQYLTRSDTSTAIGSLTIPDDDSRLTQGSKEIAYTSDLTNFVTNTTLNSTLIKYVTTDTLNNELSTKVGIDTTETITGEKTFTNDVIIQGVNKSITLTGNGSGAGKIYVDKDFGGIQIYGRTGSSGSFNKIASFNTASASISGHLSIGGNIAFHKGNLVAGEGINFSSVNGITTISSTGGGGTGDVTLAGDNSFTGNNTFDGETTFNAHTWTAEQEAVNLNVTSLATMKNVNVSGTLTTNGEINAVAINAAGIKNNQNNKYYLNQASITAGSDNLLITETDTGVQLIVNAPTNAQIEALQRLINDLSTKVDNLTTRLNNLEEVIDGGVAGSIYPADPQKIDASPIIDNALSEGQAQSEEIQVKDGE